MRGRILAIGHPRCPLLVDLVFFNCFPIGVRYVVAWTLLALKNYLNLPHYTYFIDNVNSYYNEKD